MPRYVCEPHKGRHENGPCPYCEYDEAFASLKMARANNEEMRKAVGIATKALQGARLFMEGLTNQLDDALISNRIKTENNEALLVMLREIRGVLKASNNGELSADQFHVIMSAIDSVAPEEKTK